MHSGYHVVQWRIGKRGGAKQQRHWTQFIVQNISAPDSNSMRTTTLDAAPAATPSDSTVTKSIKASWGIGALGVAVLSNTVGFFALYYMVSVLDISPFLAGAIIFGTKILDVISDPMVGTISDRAQSQRGRRRPFLIIGAIISAGSFLMIFTTPQFSGVWQTEVYILFALALYTIGYTLFNVPYMSMPAEMTDSFHERSAIHGYRMVFISVGGLLVSAGMPMILQIYGRDSWDAYAIIAITGSIIIFASMLTTYFGTAKARFTASNNANPNALNEFKIVFQNKHFLRLISVKFSQLLGVSATQAAFLFFILNSLELDIIVLTWYGLTIGAVSIVVTPLLVRVSNRIGKSKTYIIGAVCYVAVVLSWLIAEPGESLTGVLIRGAFLAVAVSGNVVMAMSMLTDTIEFDARRTGVRREGVYTSVYSFVEKFTGALGPLIIGGALSLAGLSKNTPPEAANTPAIQQALLIGISYIPATMGIIAIVLLIGYKLDEKTLDETERQS